MPYLDEDALDFYATKVAPKLSTITLAKTRQLMERRFSVSTISPIVAAIRHRLLKSETVKSYFDDKMTFLEKTGLSEEYMADQLTEGLPDIYKQHFYAARVKDTLEWLTIATKIEAEIHPKAISRQSKTSHSNYCIISHCSESSAAVEEKPTKFNQSRPSYKGKVFKKQDQPRNPCQFCKKLSNTKWHWHKNCPNKTSDVENSRETSPIGETIMVNSHSSYLLRCEQLYNYSGSYWESSIQRSSGHCVHFQHNGTTGRKAA